MCFCGDWGPEDEERSRKTRVIENIRYLVGRRRRRCSAKVHQMAGEIKLTEDAEEEKEMNSTNCVSLGDFVVLSEGRHNCSKVE